MIDCSPVEFLCPCAECLDPCTNGSGGTGCGCLWTWRGRTWRTKTAESMPKPHIFMSLSLTLLLFFLFDFYLKGNLFYSTTNCTRCSELKCFFFCVCIWKMDSHTTSGHCWGQAKGPGQNRGEPPSGAVLQESKQKSHTGKTQRHKYTLISMKIQIYLYKTILAMQILHATSNFHKFI